MQVANIILKKKQKKNQSTKQNKQTNKHTKQTNKQNKQTKTKTVSLFSIKKMSTSNNIIGKIMDRPFK